MLSPLSYYFVKEEEKKEIKNKADDIDPKLN